MKKSESCFISACVCRCGFDPSKPKQARFWTWAFNCWDPVSGPAYPTSPPVSFPSCKGPQALLTCCRCTACSKACCSPQHCGSLPLLMGSLTQGSIKLCKSKTDLQWKEQGDSLACLDFNSINFITDLDRIKIMVLCRAQTYFDPLTTGIKFAEGLLGKKNSSQKTCSVLKCVQIFLY